MFELDILVVLKFYVGMLIYSNLISRSQTQKTRFGEVPTKGGLRIHSTRGEMCFCRAHFERSSIRPDPRVGSTPPSAAAAGSYQARGVDPPRRSSSSSSSSRRSAWGGSTRARRSNICWGVNPPPRTSGDIFLTGFCMSLGCRLHPDFGPKSICPNCYVIYVSNVPTNWAHIASRHARATRRI